MREQFISEVKIERDFKYLGKAKVKWVFSVDLNQTGVEGIHLHCPDQTVDLYDIPEEEVAEDVFKPVTTETKISIESVQSVLQDRYRVSWSEVDERIMNGHIENVFIDLSSLENQNLAKKIMGENETQQLTQEFGTFELELKEDILELNAWTGLNLEQLTEDNQCFKLGQNAALEIQNFLTQFKK
jgi:hypothetical protein